MFLWFSLRPCKGILNGGQQTKHSKVHSCMLDSTNAVHMCTKSWLWSVNFRTVKGHRITTVDTTLRQEKGGALLIHILLDRVKWNVWNSSIGWLISNELYGLYYNRSLTNFMSSVKFIDLLHWTEFADFSFYEGRCIEFLFLFRSFLCRANYDTFKLRQVC